MAELIRAHPWERTALGPIAAWPVPLRTAVEIMLRMPLPAMLTWGHDEIVLINDAFSVLCEKDGATIIGSSNRERQLLVGWGDLSGVSDILLEDDGSNSGGTLSVFRDTANAAGSIAVAPDSGAKLMALARDFALLETKMEQSATEFARTTHALSADIAASSVAEAERRALQRQLAAAEEAERGRISRELHDQLGQHLTAITLGLHEVASLLPSQSAARERLGAIQELATLLTRDARYLAIELRPPELDDIGLESAVASYVEQWSQRYGVAVDLQSHGVVRFHYAGDIASAVYRIVQEALTNVARHARASQASVIIEHADDELRLIVEDNGRGFDVEPTLKRARDAHRLGVVGMQERASLVGGALTAESTQGKGTTIFARFPLG